MIPQDTLDEWQRLADAATPGPWRHVDRVGDKPQFLFVAAVAPNMRVVSTHDSGSSYPASDASFIAASREAVPDLIAEVESLRAQCAAMREHIEWHNRPSGRFGTQPGDGCPASTRCDGCDAVLSLNAGAGILARHAAEVQAARNAALEEAAQVIEDYFMDEASRPDTNSARAAVIRRLKSGGKETER